MVKKYFSRRRVHAIELLEILIYREAIEKPGTSINSVLTGRLCSGALKINVFFSW